MLLFLKKIIKKFYYASSGLLHGARHDSSIMLQCALGLITIIAGIILSFDTMEWCAVITLIVLVIALEFINSALEHVVDMISPQYDERAKIIKDYAAAAVLVVSIGAFVIACMIIGGKLQ